MVSTFSDKDLEGVALRFPQACQYFACGKATYGVRTSFRYLFKRAWLQTLFLQGCVLPGIYKNYWVNVKTFTKQII